MMSGFVYHEGRHVRMLCMTRRLENYEYQTCKGEGEDNFLYEAETFILRPDFNKSIECLSFLTWPLQM